MLPGNKNIMPIATFFECASCATQILSDNHPYLQSTLANCNVHGNVESVYDASLVYDEDLTCKIDLLTGATIIRHANMMCFSGHSSLIASKTVTKQHCLTKEMLLPPTRGVDIQRSDEPVASILASIQMPMKDGPSASGFLTQLAHTECSTQLPLLVQSRGKGWLRASPIMVSSCEMARLTSMQPKYGPSSIFMDTIGSHPKSVPDPFEESRLQGEESYTVSCCGLHQKGYKGESRMSFYGLRKSRNDPTRLQRSLKQKAHPALRLNWEIIPQPIRKGDIPLLRCLLFGAKACKLEAFCAQDDFDHPSIIGLNVVHRPDITHACAAKGFDEMEIIVNDDEHVQILLQMVVIDHCFLVQQGQETHRASKHHSTDEAVTWAIRNLKRTSANAKLSVVTLQGQQVGPYDGILSFGGLSMTGDTSTRLVCCVQ